MNAKEYLLSLGITRNDVESLHCQIGGRHYDIAEVMEAYARLSSSAQLIEVVSKSGSSCIVANDTNSVGVCNTDSFGYPLASVNRATADRWPGALTSPHN